MNTYFRTRQLVFFLFLLLGYCKTKDKTVAAEDIRALDLKRGELVSCGPPDKNFGQVYFENSCSGKTSKDFNLAVALLHSFEYDEAEKVFAKIIDADPTCAMAYWGVAMCNFHPVWAPSTKAELEKGVAAIKVARSLHDTSAREGNYIEAVARYFDDWEKMDHYSRCVDYKNAMKALYEKFPGDKEAAIFYALAIDAAADPSDRTYADQKKAGVILNAVYIDEPEHPGIVHYIIHTYDYPGLAEMALPAARKYASIAPASAHAQHMPSHIFTRLGLWDECIQSNVISTASAKCYAENAAMKGHWDEELHGMDYLMYAYLQKGDDSLARGLYNYLKTIHEVYPVNFKDAYAFAAIPSRWLLERKMWTDATQLEIGPTGFPWEKFPWQNAIFHFTRALGSVNTGDLNAARSEVKKMEAIHDTLLRQMDEAKANSVDIQIRTTRAWIHFKEGKTQLALQHMDSAADLEDAARISIVSPGDVIPARELLGDMLMQMGSPSKALSAYQEDLRLHPNRFNGLYGAGRAAEKSGDHVKALFYYQKLVDQCALNTSRSEFIVAKNFIDNNR
jgi:tetratricopeptide (TPR) repeat protein